MTYKIRPVRRSDIPHLVKNLRSADLKELMAGFGNAKHLSNLRTCVKRSAHTMVGTNARNEPVVIWGMTPYKRCGIIWAFATVEIEDHKTSFLKASRPVIREMFEKGAHIERLLNFTHGDNALHHRWLQWCHAEVLPPVPYGAKGEPFRPFVIPRDAYV